MSKAPPETPLVRFAKRFAVELGLGIVVLVLFADYLFSDLLLYGSDSIPSGLFFRGFLVDFVREYGELPRWNPYILGGLPFLDATHGDTFFPSSLLHFLYPVYRGMGHKLILHILLAGVFMAFYLRSLGLRRPAVALGSLAYMLAPIFVSYLYTGQDGKMYVVSLAPLVYGLLERGMRHGHWGTFLGLGVAIGLTILSAQIQMAYHAMWFLGALFVMRLVLGAAPEDPSADRDPKGRPPRPPALRLGAGFGVAVLIGLLVASIQLFPAVSYVKHPEGFSVRSDRTDYEHAASWSLHPEEVVSMVVPEFCPAPQGYWGRNFFKYNSDSMGVVLLVLAGLALARRRDATRWFWAAVAAFAVLYSLGEHTPLHRLFYWVVPQVKLFRAPPLVMFGAAFGFSVLAALAVNDLLHDVAHRRGALPRSRFLPVALGAAAIVALCGLAAGPFTETWNSVFQPSLDGAKAQLQAQNLPHFRNGALLAALLIGAAASLVEAFRRSAVPVNVFVGALLVLTAVDMWRIDSAFKTLMEPDRFTEPRGVLAELARASESEKFRVAPIVQGLVNNEMGYFGIESTFGFHDNELAWYRELRSDPAAQNLLYADDRGYPFLRMLNVAYVVHDQANIPNPMPVAGVLPRFRVVEDYAIALPGEMVARIVDPSFDVASTVLLESDPGYVPTGGAEPAGRVLESRYLGNEARVVVEASRPALLVQADNWFPYWRATAGGAELPILRANGVIRAIPVPAGRTEITLRFVSPPYELGKKISLATLGLTAVGIFALRRVRRRSRDA